MKLRLSKPAIIIFALIATVIIIDASFYVIDSRNPEIKVTSVSNHSVDYLLNQTVVNSTYSTFSLSMAPNTASAYVQDHGNVTLFTNLSAYIFREYLIEQFVPGQIFNAEFVLHISGTIPYGLKVPNLTVIANSTVPAVSGSAGVLVNTPQINDPASMGAPDNVSYNNQYSNHTSFKLLNESHLKKGEIFHFMANVSIWYSQADFFPGVLYLFSLNVELNAFSKPFYAKYYLNLMNK